MTSDRQKIFRLYVRFGKVVGVGLVLCTAVISLWAGEPPVQQLPPPLTIMPFQTATYVGDPETAAEFNGFAEFSSRLLYWTDMPREPILLAGQTFKSAMTPFYEEWKSGKAARAGAAGMVRARARDAYRALHGPRLARITIDQEIKIELPEKVDSLANAPVEIPCVIDNRRPVPVEIKLGVVGSDAVVFSATLQAGQARGVLVKLNDDGLLKTLSLWAKVEGQTSSASCTSRRFSRGNLSVEVLDESGSPAPARVYLTGADQRAYAPAGVMHRIVSGEAGQPFAGDAYFYTEGRFELTMPCGETTVEIVKGFEYEPVRVSLRIEADKPAVASLRLVRKSNLKAEGWYSGDVHVHANLFAQTLITPHEVLLVAQAEDLNVVNLLPCNDPRTATITDRQYFTGSPDTVSTRNHILYFNEEMRNDIYGHVGFLNLKEFVEPAYFGWPHSPYPYDEPGNFPQAAKAKAQGGVVTYVHPGLPSEFPVDIALGVADTIDVMSQNPEDLPTEYWYRLLNCGFRCPISAGTDSFLNIPVHLIPGAGRVFVKIDGEFNYERWIEGYLRGRSFASNGPRLTFSVGGKEAGSELVSDGPAEVEVSGEAHSIVPMDALELIVNGQVVKKMEAKGDRLSARFTEKIVLNKSSWVALRVRGSAHRLAPNDREVYAHTSPVYVTVQGRRIASRADALFFVEQIDALIAKMDSRGVFSEPARRDEIVHRFREAQAIYHRIAAEDRR